MTTARSKSTGTSGFICGAWRRRIEGPLHDRRTYVNRCDLHLGHKDDHIDQVILVNWPDSETDHEFAARNELNYL